MVCPNCQHSLHRVGSTLLVCGRCGHLAELTPDHKVKKFNLSGKKLSLIFHLSALNMGIGLVALMLLGGGVMAFSPFGILHQKPPATKTDTSVVKLNTVNVKKTDKPQPSPKPSATPTPTPATSTAPVASTPPKSTKVIASTPVVSAPVTIPTTCTKPTGFTAANALPISTASPGLDLSVEAPQQYTVYGNTAQEVRTQLNQCSPVSDLGAGEYDAITTWWVNFSYLYAPTSGGNCSVNSVAVGMHIKMILPAWQSSLNADSGLASEWQTYITNLTTHEDGHRDIAINYANTLLSGLQSQPESSCSTIVQTTNDYGNSLIAQLTTDENNYDTTTNHGATQGATFP